MDGNAIFTLAYSVIGGLGVFLFGMKLLSESLQAVASDLIRRVIGWVTNNRLLALTVGVVLTMIIQSSSVTTVMVVGFVNAGLMTLRQAIGVILGANIGTTITGWLIAVKVGKYGLVFVGAGFPLYFFVKNFKVKSVGKILIALGLIFLGLAFMKEGFAPVKSVTAFGDALQYFKADTFFSVLSCVVVGCLLTFVVQSSSAMLGITMTLAMTGAIEFPTAAALVLGENIGTTITMELAAIGGNIHAKRASLAHITFNVVGVSYMLFLFQPYIEMVSKLVDGAPEFLTTLFVVKGGEAGGGVDALIAMKIAASHSIFNIFNNLLFVPLVPLLVKLVTWLKPDKGMRVKKRLKVAGNVHAIVPGLALEEAEGEIKLMGEIASKAVDRTRAYLGLKAHDVDLLARIDHLEQITDNIQKEITLFLTTVLQRNLTPDQATRAYALIRLSDEIESIADYCQSLGHYRHRLFREGHGLSQSAQDELRDLESGTSAFFKEALNFVIENKTADQESPEVRDLITTADDLGDQADRIRTAHLLRIKEGECDPLAGLTFSDMIVALRRMKNHTVNMIDARIGRWEERREALRELDRRRSGDSQAISPVPG